MADERGMRLIAKVEGDVALTAALPERLTRGERRLKEKAAEKIAGDIRRLAPGGPTGSAGRAVRVVPLGDSTAAIQSVGFPGVWVLEVGATIRPRDKTSGRLRFNSGGDERFVRRVRVKGRHYFKRGALGSAKRIREAYLEELGRVG